MLSIHPSVDGGIRPGAKDFQGGILVCKCAKDPVEVTIRSQTAHNHACGCSKCWKPAGALFSVVGVVPDANLSVTANADKLHVTDPSAAILRNTCKECGTCLYGNIEKDHPFKGLSF